MSTLYLLKYNNYYNRIVKKSTSLSDYQSYLVKYAGLNIDPNGARNVIQNVNFVDGDFVDTQQVVNWAGDIPDYILVVNDQFIVSRWFVVNAEKTRGGQLTLALHRDLVADFYDNLMDEQTAIFVEKAILPSSNNLIFNSEDMSFNRIKTRETLLKDDTQCPWIVLYGSRTNGEGSPTTFTATAKTQYPFIEITEEEYNTLYAHAERPNEPIKEIYNSPFKTQINLLEALNGNAAATAIVLNSENAAPVQTQISFAMTSGASLKTDALNIVAGIYSQMLASATNLAEAYVNGIMPEFYAAIVKNQGKFLKYTPPGGTTSKYYQIKIFYQGDLDIVVQNYTGAMETNLAPLKYAFTNPNEVVFGTTILNSNIQVEYTALYLRYRLEEVSAPTTQGDGDKLYISSARYHLIDAPYDMFCLPLSDSLFIKNSKRAGFTQVKSNLFLNLSLANQLIADYSGVGQIYDAQILPYCPIKGHLITEDEDGNLIYDINDDSVNSYSTIEASGTMTPIGYVLHATQSSFAINIALEEPIVVTDYKIENECDMYRLTAPNYSSSFEFSAAKNGGISTLNVKCTYKPFNPYIKVYPDFKRLYGNDYNDARGLICGGDFSLPTLTDQWKTYELSHKNYQAAFDRQIQNLEINNSVQKEREAWNVAGGVISAGVQGATSGGLVAGPLGAIVAGGFGAGASLVGGIRDIQLNDRLRQETIEYSRDQFGYQLGNIKALPQTLTQTSAYNIDNKYFPFIEYYTCTAEEKEALRRKIQYNGMTVMQIGTMAYYVNNYTGASGTMYFKGKLIRLNNFTGDYHILNAIAEEIYKGVFI